MKQTGQKNPDREKAAAMQRASGRRKLTVVFVLFLVMAVLWIRVFVGKDKPQAASAAPDTGLAVLAAGSAELKPVYIELPVIGSRHDVLGNDFFSAENFSNFGKQDRPDAAGKPDSRETANGQNPDGPDAAVEEIQLTAIVSGSRPQVFIENKLLEEGQSFEFVFRGRSYKFRVINISEDKVELECNGVVVTRKIPGSFLQTD